MSIPVCLDISNVAATALVAGNVVYLNNSSEVAVTTATTDRPLGIVIEPCDAGTVPKIAAPGQQITINGALTGFAFGDQLGGGSSGAFVKLTATDTETVTPATPLWVVGVIVRAISIYSATIYTELRPINGTTVA